MRVRSKPSTAADSEKLEPLLDTGEVLFVIDGPTRGSSYDWYLVSPIEIGETYRPRGWVAAADHDGNPWLEPAELTCQPDPSLHSLGAMSGPKRIACYGDRTFTFTDTVYWGPMCGDPTFLYAPEFMASCWSVFEWGFTTELLLAVPADLTDAVGPREEEDEIHATVQAHMDDPAAQTCKGESYVPDEYDPFFYVLGCRSMFVATSFERLSP